MTIVGLLMISLIVARLLTFGINMRSHMSNKSLPYIALMGFMILRVVHFINSSIDFEMHTCSWQTTIEKERKKSTE